MSRIHEIGLETARAAAIGCVPGAVGGAVIANEVCPPNVDFIPGIVEGDVSIALFSQESNVAYGPTVVNMPEVSGDIPVIGVHGVNVDLTKFNVLLEDKIPREGRGTLDQLSSVATQYQSAIVDPIESALIERLAIGTGIGTVAGTLMGYKALQYARKVKRGEVRNPLERLKRIRQYPRIAAVIGLIGLAGCGGGVAAAIDSSQDSPFKEPPPTPLSALITDEVPALKGSTITGAASDLPNKLARAFVEYTGSVDTSLEKSAQNLKTEYSKFIKAPQPDFVHDSNLKVFMHASDFHCNHAVYSHLLGPLLEKFKPSAIFNTGDTFTNSDTMAWEEDCFSAFRKVIAEVDRENDSDTTIFYAIGNHDPDVPINLNDKPRVITPSEDSDYTATADDITVVTDADPSRTRWSTTPKEGSDEIKTVVAAQGSNIAKAACKAAKTGELPIVMAHRPEAGYQTILEGCASIVLNGHTHHRRRVKSFRADNGEEVLQHTAGSAAGAHNTITLFETPKVPASYTFMYFDEDTQEFKGFVTVTFHPSEKVTIKAEKPPAAPEPGSATSAKRGFLEEYSRTYKSSLAPK